MASQTVILDGVEKTMISQLGKSFLNYHKFHVPTIFTIGQVFFSIFWHKLFFGMHFYLNPEIKKSSFP